MIKTAPKSRKPWLRNTGHVLTKAWRSVALLEDTPRRIAVGSAIGTFFAFQPIVIGGQMAWSAVFARVFRGNILASLPWSWITNPFTVAPIYYGAYRLGRMIAPVGKDVGFDEIAGIWNDFDELGLRGSLKHGWELLVDIVVPLQIGSLLVGIVFAALVYTVMFKGTVWVQHRRFLRRSHWLGEMRRLDADPSAAGEPIAAKRVDR